MKQLTITSEIETALVQLMDAALKAGGMSVLQHIDKVRNAIQAIPVPPAQPVE